MKKRIAILSFGYWFSAYTLGMLLHPYKTVRELVRRPVFAPMVVVPVVMWGVMWVVGMVGLRFGWVVFAVFGLERAPGWLVEALAFVFWWVTLFLVMWQVLLGYLWIRFSRAMRADK